jgi:UDP-N-acetylmuramoyl-tripeptide--D-alanyl-D-alanine ligase
LKKKKIEAAIKKSSQISSLVKIGVTGSYGKSSVKNYLSEILSQHAPTLSTPKNINTEL